VPGGEVGFLLEHVTVFGGLGGVFDLPHLLRCAASEISSVFFFRISRAA
jgi:hypothetical protein